MSEKLLDLIHDALPFLVLLAFLVIILVATVYAGHLAENTPKPPIYVIIVTATPGGAK